MQCSIPKTNLKSWGRAIHTLATIGDNDIHLEFKTESLTLTTFDSSLSVCCTATFERDFFLSYEILNEEKISCRVPSKCILKPFRSMRFLSKAVSICEIKFLDPVADKLDVNFKCISGASLRYLILLTTNIESIQVDYDISLLKNCIQADSKFTTACLGNFSHNKGVADLTLKILENKILLKNSTTDLSKKDSSIHTEVILNKIEFLEFTIDLVTELTFPMREFKCFVNFAETMKLPLSINFHGPNEPVIVTIKGDEYYESSLTLATKLMDNDNTNQSQMSSTTSGVTTETGTIASISHVPSEPRSTPSSSPPKALSRRKVAVVDLQKFAAPNPVEKKVDECHPAPVYFDHIPASNPSENPSEPSTPICNLPVPPSSLHTGKCNTGNEINIILRRGPPHKKLKSLFPNLGKTFEPAIDIPGHNVVLVGNSDDEYEYDD